MKRRVFCLTLLVTLIVGIGVPASMSFADKADSGMRYSLWLGTSSNVSSGIRAISRNKIAKGISLLEEALSDDQLPTSDRVNALNGLCVGYIKIEFYDEAIRHCDKGLSFGSDWRLLNNRGSAYLEKGELDLAIKDFQAALTLRDSKPMVKENLDLALSLKAQGIQLPAPQDVDL